MTTETSTSSQDIHTLQLGEKEIILIGTAHISKESVDTVVEAIQAEKPDCVCLELDENRFQSLIHKKRWESLNLLEIIKKKQLATLIVNLLLSSYQKKLGMNTGVAPGSEMLEAYNVATEHKIEVGLCDRDARITLKRAWRKSPFFKKSVLVVNLIGSFFDKTEVSEEQLKDLRTKDYLSEIMQELGKALPEIKEVLIDERDIFLAEKIKQQKGKKVLAVLGAGHIPGIKKRILEDNASSLEKLSEIPKVGLSGKLLGWSIPFCIVAAIGALGYFKGFDVATDNIVYWVLANGIFCSLGALLAFAHPLTILAAFVAAPITSLTPLIGAGYVTAFVQVLVKPPTVHEIKNLSADMGKLKNWWKNRFLRVLLCFILPAFGSMIGTGVGGAKIFSAIFDLLVRFWSFLF